MNYRQLLKTINLEMKLIILSIFLSHPKNRKTNEKKIQLVCIDSIGEWSMRNKHSVMKI